MDAELLRGLAGLREAIKDWGDNMRSETMADLLAHVDRIELSVAQGQGSILPDAYMTADGRYVDPTIADQFPGAVPLYSYPPRYAAPAQPDGVE